MMKSLNFEMVFANERHESLDDRPRKLLQLINGRSASRETRRLPGARLLPQLYKASRSVISP